MFQTSLSLRFLLSYDERGGIENIPSPFNCKSHCMIWKFSSLLWQRSTCYPQEMPLSMYRVVHLLTCKPASTVKLLRIMKQKLKHHAAAKLRINEAVELLCAVMLGVPTVFHVLFERNAKLDSSIHI